MRLKKSLNLRLSTVQKLLEATTATQLLQKLNVGEKSEDEKSKGKEAPSPSTEKKVETEKEFALLERTSKECWCYCLFLSTRVRVRSGLLFSTRKIKRRNLMDHWGTGVNLNPCYFFIQYISTKMLQEIFYVLYPGDDSVEGKILRLKQQYTLCSASLQDIIVQFARRSGSSVKWDEFPEKVVVQMNDTHPTLCIPELMRILMDLKGLSWEEDWSITRRIVAYTNHTVLPEASEKWSYDLMQKLLPRHIEIIELIDEQLFKDIISECGTSNLEMLEKKISWHEDFRKF